MSHRGGARRQRSIPPLREVGPSLQCPRCFEQIARTRPSELAEERTGKKELFLGPKLDGTGWTHPDGVWRQSEHGKAHVRRGELPHPAHARGEVEWMSWYSGPDPSSGEITHWGYEEGSSKGFAPPSHLADGARVACPRCGTVARWEEELASTA